MKSKIACFHIGARAHYLIPKALESKGNLSTLVTDTWVSSPLIRALLAKFPLRLIKSFSNRHSPQIPNNRVKSFGIKFLLIEFWLRFKFANDWSRILARNFYFEKQAVKILNKLPATDVVFGISYTSLQVLKTAKKRAQKTILFQIDPGLLEEKIVADIVEQYGSTFKTTWIPAPAYYWTEWLEECALADVIMVNSEWSKTGLLNEGIDGSKIRIVPLPFQIEVRHSNFKREYPTQFNAQRPLRCLFLGTLTLRKGIHLVLEAAAKLTDLPIEFILVGQSELDAELLQAANVKYKGVATRAETDQHYKDADVFLFPTLSDGFGLTQLEALAWSLPVIASTNCGVVIQHNYNGIELADCSANQLIDALKTCVDNPELLAQLSANGVQTVQKFSIENFANDMASLL